MPPRSFFSRSRDPMTILQNRWYNELVGGLRLSSAMFQIFEPSPPIAPSDSGLWAYQNLLPPASLTFLNPLSGRDRFFDVYASVARQMLFPASSFEQEIGAENYQAWSAYVTQLSPTPAQNQLPALFRQWAMLKAPSVVLQGVSALARMGLVSAAQRALLPCGGSNAKPADFVGTYAELCATLGQASGMSLWFDSSTSSDDVSNTWTGGENAGLDGLWAGSGTTSRLSRRFAGGRVTVSAAFKAFAVWTSTPGSWYNSSLLHAAFVSRTTPPWPENADPRWEEVFGPDGTMQRFLASLVVVDGMDVTVTSHASYSQADQQIIRNHASKGLWPFYVPTNGPVVTNEVTIDRAGGIKIITVTAPGNPLVIGANVLGIAKYA
jgi:hypothetical protein